MKKLNKNQKKLLHEKLYKVHRITTTILSFMAIGLITVGLVGSCSKKEYDQEPNQANVIRQQASIKKLNDVSYQYAYLVNEVYDYMDVNHIDTIDRLNNETIVINGINVNRIELIGGYIEINQDFQVNESDIFYSTYQFIEQHPTITSTPYDITLNDIYAYTYLGGYDNDLFMSYSISGLSYNITIFDGLFYVNGQAYNKIQILYASATGTRYKQSGETSSKILEDNNSIKYMQTQYVNNNGDGVVVHVNTPILEQSSNQYYYTNNRYWRDSSYKNIHVVYEKIINTNNTVFHDFSYKQLLSIEPSYSINGATTGSSGSLDGAFGLITSCFTTFLPLLNISIAPGLTIGVLVLFPLLIFIIVLVIRLVKK